MNKIQDPINTPDKWVKKLALDPIGCHPNFVQLAIEEVIAQGGGGGGDVSSVFGRTGVVVSQAGDYTAFQVTYDNISSGLTSVDVQGAIDEVVSQIALQQTSIDTNTSNIATNTGDISNNTSDIATNTGNIATNTSDIATNAGNISTNTSDISTNRTDIDNLISNQISLPINALDVNTDAVINIKADTLIRNQEIFNENVLEQNGVFSIDNTTGLLVDKGTVLAYNSGSLIKASFNDGSATLNSVVGFATSPTIAGDKILVAQNTILSGVDTSSVVPGSPVYLGTNGDYTFVAPTNPYIIGWAFNSSFSNGVIVLGINLKSTSSLPALSVLYFNSILDPQVISVKEALDQIVISFDGIDAYSVFKEVTGLNIVIPGGSSVNIAQIIESNTPTTTSFSNSKRGNPAGVVSLGYDNTIPGKESYLIPYFDSLNYQDITIQIRFEGTVSGGTNALRVFNNKLYRRIDDSLLFTTPLIKDNSSLLEKTTSVLETFTFGDTDSFITDGFYPILSNPESVTLNLSTVQFLLKSKG